MSGLPPLPGDPAAVRLLADRLTSSAQRLSGLAGVLARLRDGATWEGPAGEAFGARLREVRPVLDAVAQRLGGAAAPCGRSPPPWRRRRWSSAPRSATTTTPSTRMPCSRTARSPSSARGPARTTPTCCSSGTSSASRPRPGRSPARGTRRRSTASARRTAAAREPWAPSRSTASPTPCRTGASPGRAPSVTGSPASARWRPPSRGSARSPRWVRAWGWAPTPGSSWATARGILAALAAGAAWRRPAPVAVSCGTVPSREPSVPRPGSP